jgi:hypothetical protein
MAHVAEIHQNHFQLPLRPIPASGALDCRSDESSSLAKIRIRQHRRCIVLARQRGSIFCSFTNFTGYIHIDPHNDNLNCYWISHLSYDHHGTTTSSLQLHSAPPRDFLHIETVHTIHTATILGIFTIGTRRRAPTTSHHYQPTSNAIPHYLQ